MNSVNEWWMYGAMGRLNEPSSEGQRFKEKRLSFGDRNLQEKNHKTRRGVDVYVKFFFHRLTFIKNG